MLKRVVRWLDTRLRDCESCSFSAATDEERARSELETALPEEVKEEKGKVEEIAVAESATTEARSLKPADRSEIREAAESAVIAAVSDEVEEEERLSSGVVGAVKDEDTLERPAEDDERIDDKCASV